MMRSLHSRLTILVSVCSAAGLLLFGLVVCLLVESQLWNQFDNALHDRLLNLTQLVEQNNDQIEIEWNDANLTQLSTAGERVTCWEGDRIIAVLPAGSTPLPAPSSSSSKKSYGVELNDSASSELSQPGRATSMTFVPRSEDERPLETPKTVTIAIARPVQDLLTTIEIIRWSLAAAAALVLVFSSVTTWLAVRSGLSPIKDATRMIARINPDRIDLELGLSENQPSELQPLLATINQLLARLQNAMDRERALSGEIAHEMRTPLAGLRAKFDVALSKPRSANEYQSLIQDCSQINDAATSMIESLMATIVPATGEERPVERVSLSQVVEDCLLQYDDRLTDRGLLLDHRIDESVQFRGNQHSTRIVVRNVVDNAVSYADEGSTIAVRCRKIEGKVELTIKNQATEFPADQIHQVFQRFWRADWSRTQSEIHSGLGLALTKRIIEANGGSIEASYQDSLFKITVRWNSDS